MYRQLDAGTNVDYSQPFAVPNELLGYASSSAADGPAAISMSGSGDRPQYQVTWFPAGWDATAGGMGGGGEGADLGGGGGGLGFSGMGGATAESAGIRW